MCSGIMVKRSKKRRIEIQLEERQSSNKTALLHSKKGAYQPRRLWMVIDHRVLYEVIGDCSACKKAV